MKRMNHALLLSAIALLPTILHGQKVMEDIAARYPASVVTRVYDISSRINLIPEIQMMLAAHFRQEDSTLATLILRGAPRATIDSAGRAMQNAFLSIITPQQANDYYSRKLEGQARREGREMAKWSQQRYGFDSSAGRMLEELYYKQQLNISKVFYTRFTDSADLVGRLQKVVSSHDSAIARATDAAAATSYINKKLATLNAIRPLSPQQRDELKNTFFRLAANNDNSHADNYHTALHRAIRDTVYYAALYKEEIDRKAKSETWLSIKNYEEQDHLTKDGAERLTAVVALRERKKALIEAAYPDDVKTRDSLLRAVSDQYDSLIGTALINDGSRLGTSQFAIAVKYREPLGLSDGQVRALVAGARTVAQKKDSAMAKNPFAKFDTKGFETENMMKIVSEEQYYQVLRIKTKNQSETEAKADWDELVKRGLSAAYNQEDALRELTTYHLAKWTAYYRYGNDDIKRNANAKNIVENAPPIVRVLSAARKYNNPLNGDAASSYQW